MDKNQRGGIIFNSTFYDPRGESNYTRNTAYGVCLAEYPFFKIYLDCAFLIMGLISWRELSKNPFSVFIGNQFRSIWINRT